MLLFIRMLPLIRWPSQEIHIMGTERRAQVRPLNCSIWTMERTSAQPKVKLSLQRIYSSKSPQIEKWNCHKRVRRLCIYEVYTFYMEKNRVLLKIPWAVCDGWKRTEASVSVAESLDGVVGGGGGGGRGGWSGTVSSSIKPSSIHHASRAKNNLPSESLKLNKIEAVFAKP